LLFADLAETLLKGGIAPRHVRRYLAELREHLDDLTAEQRAAGYDGEDAVCRARVRLGSDQELSAAMLEQKQFRSWAARAPWAVFLLLPPITVAAFAMPVIGFLVLVGKYYDFLDMHAPPPPQWFQTLATDMVAATDLVVVPLAATLFVAIAARQRLKLIWPMAATALLLVLFTHADVIFLPREKSQLVIGGAPIFTAEAWKMMAGHWPLVTAQHLLTLLPISWLAYRRRARA
jgi:hypothetical protein